MRDHASGTVMSTIPMARSFASRHATRRTIAASLMAMAAAGCTPLNDHDGLIGAEPGALPDLRGDVVGAPARDDAIAGGRTLDGLDRRHWSVTTVLIPAGQVEHQPTYFEPAHLAKGTARAEELPPTTDTVLEGPSDGDSLLLEAAAAPFVFAGEMVILPVRAIFDPPWSVHRSPRTTPQTATPAPDWRWVERAP